MRRVGFIVCLVLLAGDLAAGDSPLVVITHPSRTSRVTEIDVARIYLRKRRFWDDGAAIVPINREAQSAQRERFDRGILAREQIDLVAYWNQRYFHGVFPPATLTSDEAVKRYVASDVNAIGYIAADAIDDTVRVAVKLDWGLAPAVPRQPSAVD